MYTPKHFVADNPDQVTQLIRDNAFATMVSVADGIPVVSQLPFLYEPDAGKLWGHVAKANPHWQQLREQPDALVIFQGPHAYVSPSWYGQPGVPTWNYATVQVHGRVKILHDVARLESLVHELTSPYEASQAQPWAGEYNPRMLENIVGLEVEITQIEGKFKLSQNRSRDDRESVVRHLRGSGRSEADKLAEMMAQLMAEAGAPC